MIEGVLLTGGASTRMGRDKASIVISGVSLGQRTALRLEEVCEKITVLGPEPIYDHPNQPDLEALAGPLAALADFTPTHELVFVLACDMPDVTPAALRQLADAIGDADAAVPIAGGRLHPTCALYRASAFGLARTTISEGKRNLMAWLDRLQIVEVPFEEAIVRNLNWPADIDQGR